MFFLFTEQKKQTFHCLKSGTIIVVYIVSDQKLTMGARGNNVARNTLIENAKYLWIILCMRPANEMRRYIVASSLIGGAHTQNDPWIFILFKSGLSFLNSTNFQMFWFELPEANYIQNLTKA